MLPAWTPPASRSRRTQKEPHPNQAAPQTRRCPRCRARRLARLPRARQWPRGVRATCATWACRRSLTWVSRPSESWARASSRRRGSSPACRAHVRSRSQAASAPKASRRAAVSAASRVQRRGAKPLESTTLTPWSAKPPSPSPASRGARASSPTRAPTPTRRSERPARPQPHSSALAARASPCAQRRAFVGSRARDGCWPILRTGATAPHVLRSRLKRQPSATTPLLHLDSPRQGCGVGPV
mmetsp:Transcript_86643/g.260055  ORF Transcript_86643/g.260055 Transcript_86643/m.260055 type:complete len:241 (-) Transcript_86643:263-985(-)